MRFVVPQNITLEDKVIGTLTLKQFFYLLAGAMIGFVIFSIVNPLAGQTAGMVATVPTDLLAIALAFLKINDQPFVVFLMAALTFALQPKRRLWKRTPEKPDIKITERQPVKPAATSAKQAAKKDQLAQLAQILDSRGWEKGQMGERVVSASEQKQQLTFT